MSVLAPHLDCVCTHAAVTGSERERERECRVVCMYNTHDIVGWHGTRSPHVLWGAGRRRRGKSGVGGRGETCKQAKASPGPSVFFPLCGKTGIKKAEGSLGELVAGCAGQVTRKE